MDFQKDATNQLTQFGTAFEDEIPKQVAKVLAELAQKAFDADQYPDSSPWAPDKHPAEDHKLMFGTGELMKSYLDTEISVSGNEVLVGIGSDKPYAQLHNEGLMGEAGGKTAFQMPQRQIIPIPGDDLPPDTQQEIDQFIDGEMDKIFG